MALQPYIIDSLRNIYDKLTGERIGIVSRTNEEQFFNVPNVSSATQMTAQTWAKIGNCCLRTDIGESPGTLYTLNTLPNNVVANWGPTVGAGTVAFPASRALTRDDDGLVLECTAATLAVTINSGLPPGFACAIIPNGATTVVSGSGAPLLNGATTTLTRNSSTNASFGIIGRVSALDSYVVGGS
jgi:hypothetical protein